MPIPAPLKDRLRLPVVAAPMFLVSGPELVVAACRSGVIGSFPALNQRTTAGLDEWLAEIETALSDDDAPYAVNLIVHPTNTRLQDDLAAVVAHRVPVVITSLGAVPELVEAVHGYGGIVLHDVTTLRHARKAAGAGVDGLVLVAAGAGGHAGTLNPFALLASVRPWFDGIIALSGSLSSGSDVAAALAMGADLAYMGTRFLATRESAAPEAYRQQVVAAAASDIVYTPAVSGIPANFLSSSLKAAGVDPAGPPAESEDVKAWRDVWSAGHGVAAIDDVPSVAELVDRLRREYDGAIDRLCGGHASL
ncbi:NAD(P)H-dependent flavin oxidoreductase [Tessaracoccus flavus]|uniref:2-nitropropane dioxygenase n=1 Tax=Tessaracoccus flavus TaxID=1610493 RepID=A0A1Q2CC98_9ACTN|nr:nitronate monooxygenase family protein [Tessaracoccus flavus]AQP43743.1 2-nitropropane dioxygenase [Tessaracoccus flavus]SDY22540.1 nitronate monooxygenase [Tessaracoccus flavus]